MYHSGGDQKARATIRGWTQQEGEGGKGENRANVNWAMT